MFLKDYLSEFNYQLVLNEYRLDYLKSINEENFKNIYDLFLSYDFTYIEDIIVHYLEVFTYPFEEVNDKLEALIKKLGVNYLILISSDMRYLNSLCHFE